MKLILINLSTARINLLILPIMFKKRLLLLLLFTSLTLHANDLERDKKQLEKYKSSYSVLLWKSTKILLRSGVYNDSAAIQKLFSPKVDSIALTGPFTSYINGYYSRLNKDTLKKNPAAGYTQNQLLQQLENSSNAIVKIDEDTYPLLLSKICKTSNYDSINQFYKANGLKSDANAEHAFIALAGFNWTKILDDVALYELLEINIGRIQNIALKRSIVLMQAQFLARKGWHFLAEEKLSAAILDLETKPEATTASAENKNVAEQKKLMYSALLYFSRAKERILTKDVRLKKVALADLKKANQLAVKVKMRNDIIQIYLATIQLESGNRKGCIKTLKKMVQSIPTKTPEKLIAIQAIQGLKIKKDAEVLVTLNESVQFHASGMVLLKEFLNSNIQQYELIKSSFKPNSKHPLHLLLKQFAKIEVRGFTKNLK
jgi:hypothetical protein